MCPQVVHDQGQAACWERLSLVPTRMKGGTSECLGTRVHVTTARPSDTKYQARLYLASYPAFRASDFFIAYSMKNRGGKSGRKRHDDPRSPALPDLHQ